MTRCENCLRAIRFEKPEHLPLRLSVNASCWHHYDQEALKDLLESHPLLFPNYKRPKGKVEPRYLLNARAGIPYEDPWGCVWETSDDGITGSVTRHPLAEWSSFADYQPPDPSVTDGTYPLDWTEIKENVKKRRSEGDFISTGLPHGHTFLRLQDIRGYTNVLYDMADGNENLLKLIDMISDFNYAYIQHCLELEPDMMSYPEDLGMQVGPMVSPEHFRRFIKPVYQRMMKPARDRSIPVHMHSDGDIRALAADLIDGGVDVLNLQDLVNGIDWIRDNFAGRICIDLDIDRQRITRFGTPQQIDALIREEVQKLGSKEGGLMLTYGVYPGIPLVNIAAVMDAMERYATYY